MLLDLGAEGRTMQSGTNKIFLLLAILNSLRNTIIQYWFPSSRETKLSTERNLKYSHAVQRFSADRQTRSVLCGLAFYKPESHTRIS
jgi:hypothetical protein